MALNKRSLSQEENTRELLFGNSTNICPLQVYSNAVRLLMREWEGIPVCRTLMCGHCSWWVSQGRSQRCRAVLGERAHKEVKWSIWAKLKKNPGHLERRSHKLFRFDQEFHFDRPFNQGFCFFNVIKSPDAALVPVDSLIIIVIVPVSTGSFLSMRPPW